MKSTKYTKQLRSLGRKFARADSGNVALMFGLLTVPLMGFVGVAVDYSRANSAKAAMQAAADATALMMSKNVSTLSSTEANEKGTAYFNALFHHRDVSNVSISANYSTSAGTQLVLTGTGSVPTTFTRLMGFQQLPIQVTSTVKWGSSRLRVALVLDTTGSMALAGKMTALKTASKNLLSQLQSAATQNGDVYVSIVPFSKDVNVDSANYNAAWIDWTEWNVANGQWCKNNGQCSSTQTGNAVWTPNNHSTWNGCVVDRGNGSGPSTSNYDENISAPVAGNTASMFAAEQYGACSQPVLPLSYNWTSMNFLIDSLGPNGNTNQAIGLAHGWMSLVGGGPYPAPPAKDSNYQYKEVIILLTDGLNTQNRWYTAQSSIDSRQASTCSNVKAAGITLYTVQVNTEGDPTSTLLQNCASDAGKFFLLTSANDIITTFDQIGTQLSKLRVAK